MSHTGRISSRIHEYYEIASHGETPLSAKILFAVAVLYFLWPFDLIPDFIPVIGYFDDLIIVPTLIWLAFRQIDKARISRSEEMKRIEAVGLTTSGHCQED